MEVSNCDFFGLLPSLKLAAQKLKGSERRMFLGQIALDLGAGGKAKVSKYLGISRVTLRKGIREAQSGIAQVDKFNERGRKPLEELNPGLIASIKEIADNSSQTDPQFKSTRLYTRLSVSEMRRQLIKQGHQEADLPSSQTIWVKMHALGYKRKKVAKTKPKKR